MSCLDIVIIQKSLDDMSLSNYNPDIPIDFTQGISMYNISCKYQYYSPKNYHLIYHNKYSDIYLDKNNSIVIKHYHKGPTTRETYIGFFHVNSLRYIIPNFVYTISYSSSSIFLEYIPGDTLSESDYLSTTEILDCIAQLLLALEVAQREIGFTHFDLHLDNIILRPIEQSYTYTTLIDNIEYKCTCEQFIPTIIDYGYSCCWSGEKYIGETKMREEGILPHIAPGADIYKLLYFLLHFSLQKGLSELEYILSDVFYDFYGDTDPYHIIKNNKSINIKHLKLCANNYGCEIITSSAIYKTPLELFNLLLSKNLITSVSLNPRKQYKILQRGIPKKKVEVLTISNSYITQNYINYLTENQPIPFREKDNIDIKIFESFEANWHNIYNYYKQTISNTNFSRPKKIDKHTFTFIRQLSLFKNITNLYYTYLDLVYNNIIKPIMQFEVYKEFIELYQSIAVIVSKYIRYIDVLCTHRYKKKYNKLLSILHR